MRRFLVPDTVGARIRLYSIIMVGVPLVFATIVLIVFVKSAILKTAEEALVEQVSSHKVFIEEWFKGRQNDVKFLAELDVVKNVKPDQILPLFKQFSATHPDISAVVLIGPDGKTIVDSTTDIVVDVSDREYFIKARAGLPHVTKVIVGRTSGKAIIIFAHPVTLADGSFGGVVFLPAQLTAINELMLNLHFGKTGETYILNREGYMLTESRHLEELQAQGRVQKSSIMKVKNHSNVFEAGMVGDRPEGPYQDYRGSTVLGACEWTKGGSWLIVSELDYDEAIGPLYPFLWTIIGGFVVAMLLSSPIIIRLARSIEEPLARLSDMSAKMTRGDFDNTCSGMGMIKPPREVVQLFDAFCAMQEEVDETMNQLEKSAVTDQLTGLPNRRFLMSEGARLVDIAIRAKQPCTLFMMDIDHFKQINDTYGHTVGDTVLRQMGATFHHIVRTSDIVARYGGEEFAVVAPGSDLKSSRLLAERIRHGVAAQTFNTDEQPLACTISIGIAHYATDIKFGVDAYEDMIARADKALYEAKAAGRNSVVVNQLDDAKG